MEPIKKLCEVFEKLPAAGLKLKPSKCDVFHTKLAYMGPIVCEHGTETEPKKIIAIKNWPTSTTATEMQSFLGFTNHYRHFIHKYAHIACPWTCKLLDIMQTKRSKRQNGIRNVDSFQKLKELYSSTPILAYANYQLPFKLHTDACRYGLEMVLYQQQADDTYRVITYACHTLSKYERNYPAQKLELLVLKRAITDHFHVSHMEENLMSTQTIILLCTF